MGTKTHLLDGQKLAQGVSSFGNLYKVVDDATARTTIDAAWDCGLRYFDTAPFYGFGYSERRAGDLLREKPRDEFVLSTKVGRLLKPVAEARDKFGFKSPMPFDPVNDYSYDGVMRSVEDSLQRLGLSRIDLLFMHDLGRYTHGDQHDHYFAQATSGGFRAMAELRDSGVVGGIGLGVNETEICDLAADQVALDYILLAGRYTLLEQASLADGFLDRCMARGVRIIAAGIYNSGILATGVKAGGPLHYDYGEPPADVVAKVGAIEDLCARYGLPIAQAALQFPGAHPAVCTTLVGMTGERRVRSTAAQFDEAMPAEFWQDLKAEGLLSQEAPVPSDPVPGEAVQA